jgi:hypothetical protein
MFTEQTHESQVPIASPSPINTKHPRLASRLSH